MIFFDDCPTYNTEINISDIYCNFCSSHLGFKYGNDFVIIKKRII